MKMKSINFFWVGVVIAFFSASFEVEAQDKDERYYYKLGKKYSIMKDYATATKHYYKCMELAVANESDNPNYYFFPALMYYYGQGKPKQVLGAMRLITQHVPAAPSNPGVPNNDKESFYREFFDDEKVEIDKSDYLFLRYYVQFKASKIEEFIDAMEHLEYCVRYHDDKTSLIPMKDVYKLIVDIYTDFFKDSPKPEEYYKEYHESTCDMFRWASNEGNPQADEILEDHCE